MQPMNRPPKIVIALDKFKGSLSAPEACAIVREAILAARPEAEVIVKPLADGGDGTAATLHASLGGEWITKQVTGPLPGIPSSARYLWLARDRQAIVEMAQASGLVLLKPEQRNPLVTTTYGTGELLADAMARGARHLWLAIGGSATVDGGVGVAMALGWRFLDAQGQPVGFGGGELERLARIEPPQREFPPVEVLCDVDNPLCGPHGAARVFGPQKGATPAMVERLDAGLRHLADVVKAQLGKEILDVPGAGAAGGLAAGALAFLNARFVSGIEAVMRISRFDEALAGADWVITGEGRFDEQSLRGKVVAGVARAAQRAGAKVAVLAGQIDLSEAEWRAAGITLARASKPPGLSTAEAMQQAQSLLRVAAGEIVLAACGSGL
jgi:glycerate kinase